MASKPYIDKRSGVWYTKARLDRDGKHKAVRLGKHDAPFPPSRPPKKPPAYVIDAHHEVQAKEARVKAGVGTGASEGTDLADYLLAYVARYKAARAGRPSREEPGRASERVVRELLAFAKEKGVKTVQAAGRAFLRDFMELRATKVSANSLRTERGLLSPIWTRAAEDELIPANPWKFVKAPGKATEHVPRFYTSEEVGRIAAACKTRWHRNCVLLLANTGIRVSATLAMRWDWIDWAASVITIPPEHDKAGKGYQVAMSAGARDVLQAMHAVSRSPLLFPSGKNPGQPCRYSSFEPRFSEAVERAGVPPGTLHDLRHTFARHVADTAPIHAVQSLLGHASLQMTQRYTKIGGAASVRYVEGFRLGGETKEGAQD